MAAHIGRAARRLVCRGPQRFGRACRVGRAARRGLVRSQIERLAVSACGHFERACISINRLLARKKPLGTCAIFGDSAAFTTLLIHGRFIQTVSQLAAAWRRLIENGIANVEVIVSQDYMCEPFMLARTDATNTALARMRGVYGPVERRKLVRIHQRWTIERYDKLAASGLPCPILPVIQGFDPIEYRAHVAMYGKRLRTGMWTGVGSVCKRNADPKAILAVLRAIKDVRSDLRLHGFGVKKTSLKVQEIRDLLYTADSMAWSFSARKQGRSANDWREAKAFDAGIMPSQTPWPTIQTDLFQEAA